jgi:hypothetical protein
LIAHEKISKIQMDSRTLGADQVITATVIKSICDAYFGKFFPRTLAVLDNIYHYLRILPFKN